MASSTNSQNEHQKAMAAYGNGDYPQAVRLFTQIVATRPDDDNSKLWLASAQVMAGQLGEARRIYEGLLQGDNPELVQRAQDGLAWIADMGNEVGHSTSNGGGHDEPSFTLNGAFEESPAPAELDPFADIDSLFGNNDPFTSPSAISEAEPVPQANPFDDLFETGLEMLPSAEVSSPASNQATSPLSSDLDDGFAFLNEFDDRADESEAITQLAASGSLPSASAMDTVVGVGERAQGASPNNGLGPDLSSPLSEPIPAPEAVAPPAQVALFEIDELDSLDQEIAAMESGAAIEPPVVVAPEPAIVTPLTSPPLDLAAMAMEPVAQVRPAWLQNRPTAGKHLLISTLQGLIGLGVGLGIYFGGGSLMPNAGTRAGVGMTAGALVGIVVGNGLGSRVAKHTRNTTSELTQNFAALAQGNYRIRASVGANDEMGKLANSFNQMISQVEGNVAELQQRAAETSQAKEDLQRQVIRLLDDVEGAARGDLTVRAEVTADVLGAVADSFNLTIRSLRDIVSQVKKAAGAVNEAAYQNEDFSRSLSADALRQVEEISRTLNSVQEMTDSIRQVSANSREATDVAQQASEAALRGGEAVDRTVSGILEIRETVAETTRKVKRLAESSQEISKIVALISQIASRTNLLALNASIEAARAGESGRGFAIVADEVRQLADRAAKSSKEIEQIVLQIQSGTGDVMTAMEEGTQLVIEGTRRAEQAKNALDEIIEVNRTIDSLVRSISEATVQQTDTSRSVAQVMQNLELTASETSKESQKVAQSLMQLVAIARELQSSVGRFKVDDE